MKKQKTIAKNRLKKISTAFPDEIISHKTPWVNLTTIGVGTGHSTVIEPTSEEKLIELLKFTYRHKIPILALGAGSNTIGTDSNNSILIIKLTNPVFKQIEIDKGKVKSGAGIKLYDLIIKCAEKDIGGIAQLAGIPGTLGGSLKTNAGRLGVCIFDVIESIEGYKTNGEKWKRNVSEIKWDYRYSDIPIDVIVTSVTLNLSQVKQKDTLAKTKKLIKERNNIYPKHRNAGCIFKNPPSGHGSGKLIDISNCKQMFIGNLEVSSKHANFIINKSTATESNFLDLTREIRFKVFDTTGIYLEPEVFFVNKFSFQSLINSPIAKKIAVLKGGDSRERPVSLESAENVSNALREAGYIVKEFDIATPKIPKKAKSCDAVFPVLHGGFGEDGRIQANLEKRNIPFVGCNRKTSMLAINKIKTKNLFSEFNIPTPKYTVLNENNTGFPISMSLPVVVKPPLEGSTFGISIVRTMEEWLPGLKKAAIDSTKKILVEEYIDGFELTVGVFNGKPLPLVHICFPGELYDYDAKYTHATGETLYITPPNDNIIPKPIQKELQETAVKIYNLVKAKHLLRIDILLRKKDFAPYFIEINNIPGFTSSSLFPKAAAAADIPYIQLCGSLVKSALTKL